MKKRTEEKERKASIELLQRQSLEHHSMDRALPSDVNQLDSDRLMSEDIVVGWRVPTEQDPKRFKPQSKMKEQNPTFLISSVLVEDKQKITDQIERLRGKVDKLNGMFNSSCTHLITDKPNRAEKFLCAVACGEIYIN